MTALREAVARAINLEIKRQMAGQPLPGPASRATDWSAAGDVRTLDLALVADAAIAAVREAIRERSATLSTGGAMLRPCLSEAALTMTNEDAIARGMFRAMVDEALREGEV